MPMTKREEARLTSLESTAGELHRLIRGTGSKAQLDRLYLLLGREIERLETTMDDLETDVATTLDLARKAQ